MGVWEIESDDENVSDGNETPRICLQVALRYTLI